MEGRKEEREGAYSFGKALNKQIKPQIGPFLSRHIQAEGQYANAKYLIKATSLPMLHAYENVFSLLLLLKFPWKWAHPITIRVSIITTTHTHARTHMHTPCDQQHAWCELSVENCCEFVIVVVVVGAEIVALAGVTFPSCCFHVCIYILLRAACGLAWFTLQVSMVGGGLCGGGCGCKLTYSIATTTPMQRPARRLFWRVALSILITWTATVAVTVTVTATWSGTVTRIVLNVATWRQ